MASSHDAIVVGAGHNGLAAAVHLSAKGWKVLVLERQAVAGGAVKTAEITLPGYRHDLYAMNLSMFAGSAFHAAHAERLAAAGLAFVGTPRPFASHFIDGERADWLGVEQDASSFMQGLARCGPDDVRAWNTLSARFDREAPHLLGILGAPMPSWRAARLIGRAWWKLGTHGLLELVRLLLSSPRSWLEAQFSDARLKAMLAAWGLHLDFAPDVAGGALFPYLEAMLGQRHGMALGLGGADRMIRAMVRAIEASGGEVRTLSGVDRIRVSGGRAVGVTLDHGEIIEARRAVIANVHPRLLYGRLLAGHDAAAAGVAARLRPGPATMMVHLAVSALPQWRAGPALQQFAYVHLAPSLDQMARTYAQASAGLLPDEPVLVVGQPTAIDVSRAPEGCHILWVQVRVVPSVVRGDALGRLPAGSWDELKEAYADRVLEIIERHAPGVRQSVLGRAVLSPLDLERDNPNLVGGDSLSGSHHLDQFFFMRPAIGESRWRTRVPGLYMVGASTWPGAGTGAGSGYMLACQLAGR